MVDSKEELVLAGAKGRPPFGCSWSLSFVGDGSSKIEGVCFKVNFLKV